MCVCVRARMCAFVYTCLERETERERERETERQRDRETETDTGTKRGKIDWGRRAKIFTNTLMVQL